VPDLECIGATIATAGPLRAAPKRLLDCRIPAVGLDN
jgi:hypothetical protein